MNERGKDPEEEPEDPLPALRAEMDQMLMLAPELARAARAWFTAFEAEGFSPQQALYLAAVQMIRDPGTPPS